jgi:hypothetical protein
MLGCNGKRWSAQKSYGGFEDHYYGLSCPRRRVCEAVGRFAEDSEVYAVAERWTG